MGDSNDTARYGPKYTGSQTATEPPVYTRAQPAGVPNFLSDGTLMSPGDKPGDQPFNQKPRFDTNGTLISPGDKMAGGRITDPRLAAPQYTPGGTPPTASRMVTTPIPAPAGASMSVR
jgi:hypothetical protein